MIDNILEKGYQWICNHGKSPSVSIRAYQWVKMKWDNQNKQVISIELSFDRLRHLIGLFEVVRLSTKLLCKSFEAVFSKLTKGAVQ